MHGIPRIREKCAALRHIQEQISSARGALQRRNFCPFLCSSCSHQAVVFAAGELYEDDTGNVWIERVARIPLVEMRVSRGASLQETD